MAQLDHCPGTSLSLRFKYKSYLSICILPEIHICMCIYIFIYYLRFEYLLLPFYRIWIYAFTLQLPMVGGKWVILCPCPFLSEMSQRSTWFSPWIEDRDDGRLLSLVLKEEIRVASTSPLIRRGSGNPEECLEFTFQMSASSHRPAQTCSTHSVERQPGQGRLAWRLSSSPVPSLPVCGYVISGRQLFHF